MDQINNPKNYSIVILAAGIGSRLNLPNFSDPKSLLKINGKTLLDIILNNLKARGYTDINMILGYKYSRIINFLNTRRDLPKIKFNIIKNYSINGHGYTLYKFRQLWSKKKKDVIMLHADLYYDWKYFDDIVLNSDKDIIGITKYKFKDAGPATLAASLSSNNEVKAINYKKNMKKPSGQIICINKFSSNMMDRVFNYMNKYYTCKSNKKNSWEVVFNDFIKDTNASFYSNESKSYPWFNINSIDDLMSAKNHDLA